MMKLEELVKQQMSIYVLRIPLFFLADQNDIDNCVDKTFNELRTRHEQLVMLLKCAGVFPR